MEEALLHEQEKNGKILMQLVVMTNELNERDSQIALLKKKEEHFEQMLQERENLYKQVRRGLCHAVVGCVCCMNVGKFVREVRTSRSLHSVSHGNRSLFVSPLLMEII
jgi:shikimate kinase